MFLFSGRKEQAIDLYKKGIEELEKGISVEVQGQGMYMYAVHCYFSQVLRAWRASLAYCLCFNIDHFCK